MYPDSKILGADNGPIWGRQDPGGPYVGLMNSWYRCATTTPQNIANINLCYVASELESGLNLFCCYGRGIRYVRDVWGNMHLRNITGKSTGVTITTNPPLSADHIARSIMA